MKVESIRRLLPAGHGKIEPGSLAGSLAISLISWPRYVDITGAKYPKEFNGMEITPMQGESLLPALMGVQKKRKKPMFWEWSNGQAVRKGDWKLVRWGKEKAWDLYNLSDDPTELNNLAAELPKMVMEMDQMFQEWKRGTEP